MQILRRSEKGRKAHRYDHVGVRGLLPEKEVLHRTGMRTVAGYPLWFGQTAFLVHRPLYESRREYGSGRSYL